jgi:hypothetical protein
MDSRKRWREFLIHDTSLWGWNREIFMLALLRPVALALAVVGLTAAFARAESVPFTCTVVNDGLAVRISVTNPASTERSCLVSCRFKTPLGGNEAQVMCAHMVAAGARDVEMCTRNSGGVKLLEQTHGSADCIRRR